MVDLRGIPERLHGYHFVLFFDEGWTASYSQFLPGNDFSGSGPEVIRRDLMASSKKDTPEAAVDELKTALERYLKVSSRNFDRVDEFEAQLYMPNKNN